MTGLQTEIGAPGPSNGTERFQRVPVRLFGRFMRESRQEYPCQTTSMSPADVVLFAPVKPAFGEKVVLYLDDLGRFVGVSVHQSETGFSLKFDLAVEKRDRVADRLIWYANREALRLADNRRHERFVPLMQRALMKLSDEREIIVKILDLSISGIAIASAAQPPLGARVVIGSTPAVITRHFPEGFGAEFERQFAPGQINESTRL
jgi:hypothetical protein